MPAVARRPKLLLVTLAAAALFAGACGRKSDRSKAPPPEVTGLAAVPSSAEVVIGVDVAKLADSDIVARAVDQLFLRDAQLASSWAHVRDGCKLDLGKQVRRLMLALGPAPAGEGGAKGRPGTGPVLLIATGALAEQDLAVCVRSLVGKGGGTLTMKAVDGRSLYTVKDGARTMHFAFGSTDTVVLGTSDAYVAEALGAGKKALDHPELAAWAKLVDQHQPVWAVGRLDARVRDGLVRVAGGALGAGPTAFVGSLDPRDGAKVELGAVMASAEDGKQLESLAKAQLAAFVMAAQLKALGPVVQKVAIATEGNVVRFRVPLSMEDVNQLLSVLDGGGRAPQDAPAAPAGPQ